MDGSSYADCGLILSWWFLGADLVEVMVQGPLLLKDNHSSIRVPLDYPELQPQN
jgi:hypothetical protein